MASRWRHLGTFRRLAARRLGEFELELLLIQTQSAHKSILRAEVYACALRASQNVKKAEVWVGASLSGTSKLAGALLRGVSLTGILLLTGASQVFSVRKSVLFWL
jgi:hypothetical protein